MRKNRTLTAAITTALSLSSGVAYAQGSQFENVDSAARATEAIKKAGEAGLTSTDSGGLLRPNLGFDFTGGETVINVAADGVPFAAELFGGTGLTLPTVLSAGTTGSYMAVVYTIDGTINQNFNMTFTLDNGATFAENPILGVKDNKSGAGLTVTSLGATAGFTAGLVTGVSIGTAVTMSVGEVFRFSDHATLYRVGTAPGAGVFTFYQLGNFTNLGVVAAATSTTSLLASKIYSNQTMGGIATIATASISSVALAAVTSHGQKTLQVVNSAAYTAGWSYICQKNGFGPAQADSSQSIFKVATIDSQTGSLGILTVTTQSYGLGQFNVSNTAGGLLTTDCSMGTNGSIYRIYVPGDTVISLTANPAAAAPVNKLFQFSASPVTWLPPAVPPIIAFPNTGQYTVKTIDAVKNTITINPLSTIVMPGESLFDANITMGDGWIAVNAAAGVPKAPSSTAAGTNKAIFALNAGTTSPNLNLATNDQVMLLYKLSNVGALAAAGQKVNMQVDLRTGGALDVLVNPQRTVAVATSVKGMEVTLSSLEAGKLAISVSTGSTQFSGELSPNSTTPYGFISNTVAQIGSLGVKDGQNLAKVEDGTSTFKLQTKVLADNSKLKVTGGQFQASKNSPGKVFINATSNTGSQSNISADFVTQDAAGDWSALWNLDSSEMASIANANPAAYISIQTDGTAEVNTVENAPHGAFTLDFNNAAYKDITAESDLRKISKDGTVCTVYQIPPPAPDVVGADLMSIRIINDSAIAAKVKGTLYDMDGNLLGTANTDLSATELAAGATLRIESDKIGQLFGGVTWSGRAVLKIISIMPQMEVMALIRQRNTPFAPLSNLSSGAKGTSCESQ